MNILYQSDDNYAPYMGVSICSLFENNKSVPRIQVYIINDSISEENIQKLNSLSKKYGRSITYLDPSTLLEDDTIASAFGCTGKRWNSHSYLKLLFQKMLKDFPDRLLYIDCDTVVVSDLTDLFRIDMENCPVGMVQDSLITNSKESIGIMNTDRYFNSGVIMIDVGRWKAENCEDRILDHLRNVRVYGTIDQDVLNVVLRNAIMTLPVKYNLQPVYLDYSLKQYNRAYRHVEPYYSDEEIQDAILHPVIYHFLRYLGQSPWHKNSLHPCKKHFDYYLERSPWKGLERKEGKNSAAFKIERVLYKVLPKNVFLFMFNIYHEHMIRKGNSKI